MHREVLNSPERSSFAHLPLGRSARRPGVVHMSDPTNPTPSARPRVTSAWTLDDVAAYLGCTARTVRRLLAEDPTFPQPRQVGRRLLWAPTVVPRWLERTGETRAAPKARSRGRAPRVSPSGVSDRV